MLIHLPISLRMLASLTLRSTSSMSCSYLCHCIDTSPCSSLPSSGCRGRPSREPCGSPPSSVLWTRKTARLSVPAPPVSLGSRRLSVRVIRFSRGSPRPPETGCLGVGRHLSPDCGETASSPGFTGSPLVSMPRARDSGDPGSTSHGGGPDAAFR